MISAEEFAAAGRQLEAACMRCLPGEPGWRWQAAHHPFAASMGGGYLSLQRTVPVQRAASMRAAPSEPSSPNSLDSGSIGELSEEEDPARAPGTVGAPHPQPLVSLTCHAAYHLSYRVPVLYFEAASAHGEPLGLDASLAALPQLAAAAASGQPGTVVTHEEHPLLRRPFFMLHPCQTEAVMQLLTAASDGAAAAGGSRGGTTDSEVPEHPLRYLLAWLSVAGQPLGVSPPAQLWAQAAAP